jgi:hypothetical protein
MSDRASSPPCKVCRVSLGGIQSILRDVVTHRCPVVLLLRQQMAVIRLLKLVYPLDLLLMLLQVVQLVLREMGCDVRHTDRRRARPGQGGGGNAWGRIPKQVCLVVKVVLDMRIWTRRSSPRRGALAKGRSSLGRGLTGSRMVVGVSHHQVDRLLVACPDLPQNQSVLHTRFPL